MNNMDDFKNPFIGLQSYGPAEVNLYNGRENEKLQFLLKLTDYKLNVLVGKAGVGRSSFMNSRIIPTLQNGFVVKGVGKWKIALVEPSNRPIRSLAASLAKPDFIKTSEEQKIDPALIEKFENILSNRYGLVEIIEEYKLTADSNILIFIDNFSDLFTYGKDSIPFEIDNFLRRIEEIITQNAYPVSVIIDFKNDDSPDISSKLAGYQILSELINRNQFLLPSLSLSDISSQLDFIESKGNIQFSNDIKKHVLAYYKENSIELGQFQYAMKRCVDQWRLVRTKEPIQLEHLESIGGIANAMNYRLDLIYDGLSVDDQVACQLIMNVLAAINETGTLILVPRKVMEVANYTDLSSDKVIEILKIFLEPSCGIIKIYDLIEEDQKLDYLDHLLDTSENVITAYAKVSIFNEMVLYNWSKLEEWIRDEKLNADIFKSILFDVSKGESLYEGEKLRHILAWWKESQPKKGWASRYDYNYEIVCDFIEKSEQQYNIRQRISEEEETSRKRKARRNVVIGSVFFIVTLFLILISSYFTKEVLNQKNEADKSKMEAQRERESAEIAQLMAKDAQEKAEGASFKAKQDSVKSYIASQEAILSAQEAQNAMRQASAAKRQADEIFNRLNESNQKLEKSEIDIYNKKKEFEYYETLGKVNRIYKEVVELTDVPITKNVKIAANLVSYGYELLKSLDRNDYNELIRNFPDIASKMNLELQLSQRYLIQSTAIVLQNLETKMKDEFSKIIYGTKLDTDTKKSKIAVGSDEGVIFELNLASGNSFYTGNPEVSVRYPSLEGITSGIRSMTYGVGIDEIYSGTVDGKFFVNSTLSNLEMGGSLNDPIIEIFSFSNGDVLTASRSGSLGYLKKNGQPGQFKSTPEISIKHQINAIDYSIKSEILAINGRLSELEIWGKSQEGELTFTEKIRIEGLNTEMSSLKFVDSKNWIVIANQDGGLIVYDFGEKKVIFRNNSAHISGINQLALDPLERFIVSGGRDSFINVWNIDELSENYVPIKFQMTEAVQDIVFLNNDWFSAISRGQNNVGLDRNAEGRFELFSVNLDLFIKKLDQWEPQWIIEDFANLIEYQKYLPN